MSILQQLGHLRIPLEDVKQATNNFSAENFIGYGGYGLVYRGELLHSDGLTMIAAKRVDPRFNHAEYHFLSEIEVLLSYKHANIVSLIGFCDEYDEKILVQGLVTYGSLDQYLSSTLLTWVKRLQICLGAARGLSYLHNGLEGQRVVHGVVKSRSILLDNTWQPKIGGLGLCMIGRVRPNIFVKDGFHTPGYVDPTYFKLGVITTESDVYSFGVVLFEVLCGREAFDRDMNKPFLGPLARTHYEKGTLSQIVDPFLTKQMNHESLKDFSAIAYQCLEKLGTARPTMIEIVQKLEKVLRLQQDFETALAFQQVALGLKGKPEHKADSYKVKNLEHMKIPLEQIKLATHDFHDDFKIGRGGYGKVYKVDLFHFDVQKYYKDNIHQRVVSVTELLGYRRRKSTVAVKRLDRKYGQGTAEFLQEISVLPYFRHQNLVTLLGFCDEDQERILVYEYASNGSLDEYISSNDNKNNYSWAQHLQICLDAARGLEFLHNGVGEHHRIIHRDIKSSNILLGHNCVGKIGDFGLSRIGPANLQATFVMTQVAGTLEYVDPQYHKTGMLTKGSDVYSFGVVLFEVLSGRLAYFQRSKDDQEYLLHMAKRCFEQNKLNELISSRLKKEFEKGSSTFDGNTFPDSVSIFAIIAFKCIQENRDDRPTMSHVVEELERALKSQVKGVEALRMSLEAVRFATHHFSNIIDKGGYDKVYRGELSDSKGHKSIIVKSLDHTMGSYEDDFYKEISILYSFSHKNVIPIIGFCEEAGERIVVFEHMVNGSLKGHVKNASLTWKQRLKISIDAARGLAYIHSGSDSQYSMHGDIKSSSILLNNDWEAVVSDFIISKGVSTLGYYDPLYTSTGILTQKSDVYSFGVVLFETLCGRLAIETIQVDQQQPVHGDHEDGQVVFLSQLAVQCFKNKRLEEIIFDNIKEQIDAKSLVVFSNIAYQCLQELPKDRPRMVDVVKELEKAYECQDEWEWEQKLPNDYRKIIGMSKFPLANTSRKKDLYSLLSLGILLHNDKLWFSISMNGVKIEMVSAKMFSFKSVKWRSIKNSRFSKAAKISDNLNLNIQIQIKPQLLSPGIMYGAYLVFKFCNRRKVSTRPLYVNLKYKMAGETLNAYFAKWRPGGEWLMVELFRFWNTNETVDCDILLQSFSQYYCGNWGIFVEGLEFNAIASLEEHKENNKLSDENNVERLMKPELYMDSAEQMVIDYEEIFKRSEHNIQNTPKEELCHLLFNGFLIDKGEKIFFLSKANQKKCHMLRAKSVICDASNVKFYGIKPEAQSRYIFEDAAEILYYHEFRIKCDVDTQMLSSDTSYACFLVFKLSEKYHGLKFPVKARDLLPSIKQRTNIISFTAQSTVNLNNIKWIPEQREDGWMEVRVWETISDRHNEESVPMDLKLISFEGNMSGLIISGIEFRPM